MEKWRINFENSLYLNFCSFIDLMFLIFWDGLNIVKDSKIAFSISQIVEAFQNYPFLFILFIYFKNITLSWSFRNVSYYHTDTSLLYNPNWIL